MVHGERPEIVHTLHIVRPALYNVAKLISAAVDLLACELDNNDRVLFQKLDIHKFNFAGVQNCGVCTESLGAAAVSAGIVDGQECIS